MHTLSVIELLEDKKGKKSDFIITEYYNIRLSERISKLLLEKFKLNLNKKYIYNGKQCAFETIIYGSIREIENYKL